MNKLFAFLLIPFYLTSCDNIGSTKVKNLVDLTPKLEVEAATPPLFSTGKNNPFKEKKTSFLHDFQESNYRRTSSC